MLACWQRTEFSTPEAPVVGDQDGHVIHGAAVSLDADLPRAEHILAQYERKLRPVQGLHVAAGSTRCISGHRLGVEARGVAAARVGEHDPERRDGDLVTGDRVAVYLDSGHVQSVTENHSGDPLPGC